MWGMWPAKQSLMMMQARTNRGHIFAGVGFASNDEGTFLEVFKFSKELLQTYVEICSNFHFISGDAPLACTQRSDSERGRFKHAHAHFHDMHNIMNHTVLVRTCNAESRAHWLIDKKKAIFPVPCSCKLAELSVPRGIITMYDRKMHQRHHR